VLLTDGPITSGPRLRVLMVTLGTTGSWPIVCVHQQSVSDVPGGGGFGGGGYLG
jgi:hypothetical protein